MIYRTAEGGVGYEIDTGRNVRELYIGDTLVKGNGGVKIYRGLRSETPSQSPAVTALPKGKPGMEGGEDDG